MQVLEEGGDVHRRRWVWGYLEVTAEDADMADRCKLRAETARVDFVSGMETLEGCTWQI